VELYKAIVHTCSTNYGIYLNIKRYFENQDKVFISYKTKRLLADWYFFIEM